MGRWRRKNDKFRAIKGQKSPMSKFHYRPLFPNFIERILDLQKNAPMRLPSLRLTAGAFFFSVLPAALLKKSAAGEGGKELQPSDLYTGFLRVTELTLK